MYNFCCVVGLHERSGFACTTFVGVVGLHEQLLLGGCYVVHARSPPTFDLTFVDQTHNTNLCCVVYTGVLLVIVRVGVCARVCCMYANPRVYARTGGLACGRAGVKIMLLQNTAEPTLNAHVRKKIFSREDNRICCVSKRQYTY